MKVALVTGGSGLLGANLIRSLISRGYRVKCLDFDQDHRAFSGLDIELIPGDVTNASSLTPELFNNVD